LVHVSSGEGGNAGFITDFVRASFGDEIIGPKK
jgi:hypothetical protein